MEIFKEKDKNKHYVFGNKEKGNEHWRNKREISERNNIQKRGQNKRSPIGMYIN